MQEGNLVHRFRNNYATRLSADLIAQELHTQIRILRDHYSYLRNDVLAEKRMKYMRSIHFRKKTCFVSIASGR